MAKIPPFAEIGGIPELTVEFAKNLTIEKIIREIDKYDEDVENAAKEHITFFGQALVAFQEALIELHKEYGKPKES